MLSPFEELRIELNRVLGLDVKGGPSLRVAREFVEELKMLPSDMQKPWPRDHEPRP